jgi:hypothetical protein
MASPRLSAIAVVALVAAPSVAQPLRYFPAERMAALAPLLVHGEMAAIETDGAGRPRQITLLAYAAAPPRVAREVVLRAERYPEFIRNLTHVDVTLLRDGAQVCRWQMQLPIGHFNGGFVLRALGRGEADPVEILSADRAGYARWEFLAAPGGGTVIVEYLRYEAPRQNALLAKMVEKDPANETGMGLAAALLLGKSVATEAGKRAALAKLPVEEPRAKPPGFDFLLARGAVAVIRSTAKGGLLDVSVVERIAAPLERVLAVVRAPETWPEFMPQVTSCKVLSTAPNEKVYQMSVDGVLLSIDTRYRMQLIDDGADSLGIEGDLKDSRLRWDLSRDGDGTMAVYRANHHVAGSGLLLRALIGFEPLFEHGVNVGVGVIAVQAVARRAMAALRPN